VAVPAPFLPVKSLPVGDGENGAAVGDLNGPDMQRPCLAGHLRTTFSGVAHSGSAEFRSAFTCRLVLLQVAGFRLRAALCSALLRSVRAFGYVRPLVRTSFRFISFLSRSAALRCVRGDICGRQVQLHTPMFILLSCSAILDRTSETRKGVVCVFGKEHGVVHSCGYELSSYSPRDVLNFFLLRDVGVRVR